MKGQFVLNRRGLLIGAGATTLAACAPRSGSADYELIDANAKQASEVLFEKSPEAAAAAKAAAGYLVFPNITKAGLVLGGMIGDGTLYAKRNVIGHYRLRAVSAGLQAGIQNFAYIIFFMTPEAMANFRSRDGLEVGTDFEYALPSYGAASYGASSQTFDRPVYTLIFNQEGVMVGASLKGAIYNQI